MDMETIGLEVDRWIDEEDLAANPTLKVVRKYDIYAEMDEDEVQAHREFIHWYLTKGHQTIMSLPETDNELWAIELDEDGCDVSAFNTHDFEKRHPFNKYHYKLRKIYEKVQDLAIYHSCLSDKEAKVRQYQRAKELVNYEFRDKAVDIFEHWKKYPHLIKKELAFERIHELNDRIRKCKSIWREYANWGTEGR